jgi:hypothetical protein
MASATTMLQVEDMDVDFAEDIRVESEFMSQASLCGSTDPWTAAWQSTSKAFSDLDFPLSMEDHHAAGLLARFGSHILTRMLMGFKEAALEEASQGTISESRSCHICSLMLRGSNPTMGSLFVLFFFTFFSCVHP